MSNITSSVTQNEPQRRQKRMGPAPFASFEDLSDEVRSNLESPDEKQTASSVVRLPGIREDVTPSSPIHQQQKEQSSFVPLGISLVGASYVGTNKKDSLTNEPENKQMSSIINLQTPRPPRIDVSRASSSSHHEDSRDSTPERELFEGTDQKGAKLGTGFKEEGTLDLRSSTEELDFQDSSEKAKSLTRPHSPLALNESLQGHQRKDSQSSEIGLLSISGRTSRLSSIGSQCSAQSRISNTSHLSVISGASGRSSSPHKMLLETSFCGQKQLDEFSTSATEKMENKDSDELEKVLLSRKHDPTQAILAEGITIDKSKENSPKPKKERKVLKSEITVKIDKPEVHETNNETNKPKLPRKIISASGVEYIYIPLKGPIPQDSTDENSNRHRSISSATTSRVSSIQPKVQDSKISKSASASPAVQRSTFYTNKDEPKYIRIKLKPDHMYEDSKTNDVSSSSYETQVNKPINFDINEPITKSASTSRRDLEVEVVNYSQTLDAQSKKNLNSVPCSSSNVIRNTNLGNKSPSPSLSRKSSFSLIFKTKDNATTPDSPNGTIFNRKSSKSGKDKKRSRSKSREKCKPSGATSTAPSSTESLDVKSKQKSVISLFKSKNSSTKTKSCSNSPEISTKSECVNILASGSKPYFETPLQGESIRIPLHSPTNSDQKTVVNENYDSIESCSIETEVEINKHSSSTDFGSLSKKFDKRQSSTSSDNIVFSTKLGSNEEIFSTKLPKEKVFLNEEKIKVIHADVTVSGTDKENRDKVAEKKIYSKSTENNTMKESISLNGDINNKFKGDVELSLEEVQTVVISESLKNNESVVKHIEKDKKYSTETEIISMPTQSSCVSSTKTDKNEQSHNAIKTVKTVITNNRISMISGDEEIYSSESEKDSELDYLKPKRELEEKLENLEPERLGLVFQQESFEEDLPYTPTTLPLERSVAVPIVPVKQRGNIEMKTVSIDRPRSTTPINLTYLEAFRDEKLHSSQNHAVQESDKIKISLPKELSHPNRSKSVKKITTSSDVNAQSNNQKETVEPSTGTIPKESLKEWINFEEIPEKRKPPRRIQTIPSKTVVEDNVVYTYVNPEDCKCECHESSREKDIKSKHEKTEKVQEDELPLLEDEFDEEKSLPEIQDKLKQEIAISDRRSVISDSSVDISNSLEPQDTNCIDQTLRTPFNSDLGISSNRSSVVSQEDGEVTQKSTADTSHKFPES